MNSKTLRFLFSSAVAVSIISINSSMFSALKDKSIEKFSVFSKTFASVSKKHVSKWNLDLKWSENWLDNQTVNYSWECARGRSGEYCRVHRLERYGVPDRWMERRALEKLIEARQNQ